MKRFVLAATAVATAACGAVDPAADVNASLTPSQEITFSTCYVLRDDAGAAAVFAELSAMYMLNHRGEIPVLQSVEFIDDLGNVVWTIPDLPMAQLGADAAQVYAAGMKRRPLIFSSPDFPTSVRVTIDGEVKPACQLAELHYDGVSNVDGIDTVLVNRADWDRFDPAINDYGNCPDCLQTVLTECMAELNWDEPDVNFGPGETPIADCEAFRDVVFPE